jgi:hypothetical protein
MSVAAVIAALGIPSSAMVEQRVPKKLLLENGAPTVADKRRFQDGIEEVAWVAALKPTNIGVPAFKDNEREYLEIAVLTVLLRPSAKVARLTELVHRAIPYPLVLLAEQGKTVTLSLAHKRWSQGETGKVVVDDVRGVAFNPEALSSHEAAFLASVAIARLPARDLFTLYDGMLARLAALDAARITGAFAAPVTAGGASALCAVLDRHARLKRELELVRAQAAKEKQINRRVELNTEIKRIEAILSALKNAILKENTGEEPDRVNT